MPHYKGVSHKSDRKILATLLENKRGLSWTELLDKCKLNKDTLAKRLKILAQNGKIIRRTCKAKRYYVPWSMYEQNYYYVYNKYSPNFFRIKDQITEFLKSNFGEIEEVSVSKDMKITIKLGSLSGISIMARNDFQSFMNEYPWIKDLPSDADVIGNFIRWYKGELCLECLKIRRIFPTPLRELDSGEYVCPNCGLSYSQPPIPPP